MPQSQAVAAAPDRSPPLQERERQEVPADFLVPKPSAHASELANLSDRRTSNCCPELAQGHLPILLLRRLSSHAWRDLLATCCS